MKKKLKARIAELKVMEKNAADLAAKYAKSKTYRQAVMWYRAADYHLAVREELERIHG